MDGWSSSEPCFKTEALNGNLYGQPRNEWYGGKGPVVVTRYFDNTSRLEEYLCLFLARSEKQENARSMVDVNMQYVRTEIPQIS